MHCIPINLNRIQGPKTSFSCRNIVRYFCLLFLFAPVAFANSLPHRKSRIILWNNSPKSQQEKFDQEAFLNTFSSIGIPLEKIAIGDLTEKQLAISDFAIAPLATASILSHQQKSHLKKWVQNGGRLIFDHKSALSDEFKIQLLDPKPVETLNNQVRNNSLTVWRDIPSISFISVKYSNKVKTFYSFGSSSSPIVIGGELGKGKYVFFSTLYDDLTPFGFGRFNDLPQIASNFLGITSDINSNHLEAYLDPSDHFQKDPNEYVRDWAKNGIRAVHIGAWYFDGTYPVNYEKLVNAAHANHISAYAWFEWPHVSKQFWDDHPECREKTAFLKDANVDWRLLINLKNKKCRESTFELAKKTLQSADWDGVDIAEIYLDPVDGLKEIETFTPLNDDVRLDFKQTKGFDPVELFNENSIHYWKIDKKGIENFFEYRRGITKELTDYFLNEIQKLNTVGQHNWDIVLTITDVLEHPELADNIAIDLKENISLAKKYGATLEIQDEYFEWAGIPNRYETLANRYKALTGKDDFIVDINLVPDAHEDQKGFATEKQTGTELAQLLHITAKNSKRVIIYSEGTVEALDWPLIPKAIAPQVSMNSTAQGLMVNAPRSFSLDKQNHQYIFVDGKEWPCQNNNTVWISSGNHYLTFSDNPPKTFDPTQIQILNQELLNCESREGQTILDINSPFNWNWVSRPEDIIYVDEKLASTKEYDGKRMAKIPKGTHTITIKK